MFVRVVLFLAFSLLGVPGFAQDEKPTCQDQLIQTKAMVGNYQNDYVRKVNEVSMTQMQLVKANQRIQALEKELADLKKTEKKAE